MDKDVMHYWLAEPDRVHSNIRPRDWPSDPAANLCGDADVAYYTHNRAKVTCPDCLKKMKSKKRGLGKKEPKRFAMTATNSGKVVTHIVAMTPRDAAIMFFATHKSWTADIRAVEMGLARCSAGCSRLRR